MRRSALIIGYKDLSRSPRILKEISWLSAAGWTVDCAGFGNVGPDVTSHFPIKYNPLPRRLLAYLITDPAKRFRFQYQLALESSLPELAAYELIIIHEPTLLPSRDVSGEIIRRQGVGVVVDLHEDHLNSLSRNRFESIVFERYRQWERQQMIGLIKSLPAVTVTTVSPRIASRYSDAFGREVKIVRNSPSHIPNLTWSNEKVKRIQLVHHGVGTTYRGIEMAIRALGKLDDRFDLHLMLVAGKAYLAKLRLIALMNGVLHRVKIHPPVPTKDIPRAISRFDLALVIIEPVTDNELDAFPNKFFESIQGRLGVVIGPSPELLPIVQKAGNGVAMESWTTASLVAALEKIGPEEVSKFRKASDQIAEEMSSEADRLVFLKAVNLSLQQRH